MTTTYPDLSAEEAAAIIDHVNEDHPAKLLLLARAFTPAPAPVSTGNNVLDFIGTLLGAITNNQMQDPARSAYDRKVSDLQGQGYALQQTRQTNTGFVGTLVKGGSTVTVTVDRGANRTVRVNVSETTTYRY